MRIHAPDRLPTLDVDGAALHACAVGDDVLGGLERLGAALPVDRAGIRLHGRDGLAELLAPSTEIGAVAASTLGAAARPVRAILFDKHRDANWSLAWHQDRTIVVRDRVDVPGYGPWTIKAGLRHVAPPFALLERMVTLRVHIDPVSSDNAPLLIAPGSHRLGRIAETDIDAVVASCGTLACLAGRGDIWAYSTPILHASDAVRAHGRRRVLQIDYSTDELDGGLEWLGV
ncbi:phytanoyl-CoA dioxygenase family protein [Sphingomonas colocasiae]|uniref:Phytanoyl-CoA dioxygenase family protein n=1 Tax=Sphingomonas colocasiae TaxID=1848973 RepID=A0ABS7PXV9_9SPHN|nr:phytanoyl-CoA dioxygenase family protein [Sphingomonas colocasiae]MBY8825814.1 phytanoyl-CoA dioxygenase family protein [Sphingomonas colocasiae]